MLKIFVPAIAILLSLSAAFADECYLYAITGSPVVETYVGYVRKGIVRSTTNAGGELYVGNVENGIVRMATGAPVAGYGTYVGNVESGIVRMATGAAVAGYGTYVGNVNVQNGAILKGSDTPVIGYGLYAGYAKGTPEFCTEEAMAAGALLLLKW